MNVIGLGTDLVDINKLKKKLSGKYGKRFLENTFTENEICCAQEKNIAKFATAFAAKEATYKAFQTGWIEGKEVELLRDPDTGAPSILLHGEIKKIAKKKKVKEIHVSLSFTDSHAIAVVLLTSEFLCFFVHVVHCRLDRFVLPHILLRNPESEFHLKRSKKLYNVHGFCMKVVNKGCGGL